MNNISGIYESSELALATYALLQVGDTDRQQPLLFNPGVSYKQAEKFAASYPTALTH